MATPELASLQEKIRMATISAIDFINNDKSIYRKAEESIRENSKTLDFIVEEIEAVLSDPTNPPLQRFLALFLLKELSRQQPHKRLFALIKAKILGLLVQILSRMRGKTKLRDTGTVLKEYALGEEFFNGIHFYQLAFECINEWGKISNDPEFSSRLSDLSNCPRALPNPIYFNLKIDDLDKANSELAKATSSSPSPAPAQNRNTGGQGELQKNISKTAAPTPSAPTAEPVAQIVVPRYNFSTPIVRELENLKLEFVDALNNPNANKATIEEKRIMLASHYDGNLHEFENALAANLPSEEVSQMISLLTFMHELQSREDRFYKANTIAEIRQLMQEVVKKTRTSVQSEPKPLNTSQRQYEYNPAPQNFQYERDCMDRGRRESNKQPRPVEAAPPANLRTSNQ